MSPTDWQKDYFQGRDAVGRESGTHHMTKVKPPLVRGLSTAMNHPAPASFAGQESSPAAVDANGRKRERRRPRRRPSVRRRTTRETSVWTGSILSLWLLP